METLEVTSDFVYTDDFAVTADIKQAFDINGFILIRNILNEAELSRLKTAIEDENGISSHKYGRDDGEGRSTKLALWNNAGDDITGAITRSEKVAGTIEKLLGGDVYHYHSKVTMKDAHSGGAFIWHQDYGYWYENGCLFPNMGTIYIAIDKATKENGCLKVIPGSHLLGRINHVRVGEQVGADLERVEQVQKVLPLIYVEMSAGDALFFHCNLLHRSDQNNSDYRRWGFLSSFNRADNNPIYKHHHPGGPRDDEHGVSVYQGHFAPLVKVKNEYIMECPLSEDASQRDFMGDNTTETYETMANPDKET